MDLTPFVDNVRREMAVAAEAGGEEARALAERLTAPLVSAIRLTLLDALAAAAEEITRDLAPGSVEVRLRTGEATFAVNTPSAEREPVAAESTPVTQEPEEYAGDDGSMVRINLRLSENLKARIEEAAAEQGRSVNAWLVRAAATALQQPTTRTDPGKQASGGRSPRRFTGWVS